MKIKRYTTPEEVRRDIAKIARDLSKIETEIDQFQEALAYAYDKLTTYAARKVTLRDSRKPGTPRIAKIPGRALKNKEIAKTFGHLKQLTEERAVIQNIIIQLEQNFEQTRPIQRMLVDAQKARKKINKALVKAKKVSDKLAARHLPASFAGKVKSVYNRLVKELDQRFEDSNLQFVIAQVNNTMHYTAYLKFTELKDDEGYVYSEFYVVISEVVEPTGDASYHLTTLTDFRLPGKFAFTKYSKIEKLRNIGQLVSERLATEKFVSKVVPKNLPLTQDQIQLTHDRLERTTVKDNKIFVTLKKRTAKVKAEEIRIQLHSQLTNLVKARFPRNRDLIRSRLYKSGDKYRVMFVFTISHNYRGILLDESIRRKIKETFQIDDKQLNRMQDALDQAGDF